MRQRRGQPRREEPGCLRSDVQAHLAGRIADLSAAIVTAQVAKPIAAVLLDQPEAVSLLRRAAAARSESAADPGLLPVYGFPESAARALGHAASYQIPVVDTRTVADEAAAIAAAAQLGGHVVLKADVAGLVHKT